MKVINLGIEEICESDFGECDWLIYEYSTGCYDGMGNAIHKKNGKFYLTDLGHCSCYGPTEHVSDTPYDSLEELLKNCSDELKSQIAKIVTKAGNIKKEYK